VPYDYLSTQDVSKDDNLNAKYDAIIFPPVGRGTQVIVNGLPMFGNPLPWKKTDLTPNLGSEDSTDDMRPGLGWSGVQNLQNFVRKGGLLITSMDTADFAGHHRLRAGTVRCRASAVAHRRQCRAIEDGR
jgi:hypothetical protein